MMKIGFIGLGIMGSRMAANLIKSGFDVEVYNRTPGKAEKLAAMGAGIARTISDLARGKDVVISMVSTPEAVRDTALGESGLLAGMKKGSIWIDSSTVNPTFTLEMAGHAGKAGIRFIDAPVAGSLAPAENAQLVFLAGGAPEDIEQVKPLLDKMGRLTIHAGGNGKGSALKIIVNMIMGEAMLALCEGLTLGKELGFDPAVLFDNLMSLPVTAPVFKGKKDKFLNEEYSPEFPLRWMHKDLLLAGLTAYEENVALPGLAATREAFGMAKRQGYGESDISALISILNESK